jgi:mRNA interferase MazF
MTKGEVWRVRLPFAPGHRQAGDRPAILIQDDALTAVLPTAVMIPFTSNLAITRFPATLLIQPDTQNGLTVPSVALVFQVSALDKRDFLRRLGVLDPQTLDQVFTLLDQLTGR